MERPEKRNYNKAAPKQKQYGGQGGKGKQEQSHQKPRENERDHPKKNQGNESPRNDLSIVVRDEPGKPPNLITKGKGANALDWRGPDIMGDTGGMHGGEHRPHEGRGGRDGCESMGHPSNVELDLATIQQESGYTNLVRGSYNARRGTFPNARGGSRGAGRHSAAGGRGNPAVGNYMSTNQYYSLMANGEFDVDGCGESGILEMDVQPSTGANNNTTLCIAGGNEFQGNDLQGGISSTPGMNLPC